MSRRRRVADSGLTLTELLVGMMIFGLLMVIVMSVMIMITNMSKDTLARSRAIDEARLGLAQIDRQVRSGNVILDPAEEDPGDSDVPKFFSMRIFTQADGLPRCAQWRVIDHDDDGFGNLEFRTWDPGYPDIDEFTTWSPVAHNVVDMSEEPPASATDIEPDQPETWPPFWVNTTLGSAAGVQFVEVTLRLKDPQEDPDAKPTSISTTVTGRNTVFNYPESYCSDVPPP